VQRPSKIAILGLLIGGTSLVLSIYFNLFRNPKTAAVTKKEFLHEVESVRDESYKVELAHRYQDRLAQSTLENEIAAARSTLQELQTFASWNRGAYVKAEQLTYPQYLQVLYEAHLIHRFDVDVTDGDQRRWAISGQGSSALAQNDLGGLRYKMEQSLERAHNYGITLNNILYGRYWGAGFVTESSYGSCNKWDTGESDGDNRIHGSLKVEVLTGIMWNERPFRAGEIVFVKSDPSNIIAIRGCPKRGDVVGYVEYTSAELWERISSPAQQAVSK
jgi:hypothetical protein